MGTQKNRLNETILLSTQNIDSRCWISNYLQFYAQKLCLSKPMDMNIMGEAYIVRADLRVTIGFILNLTV